MDKKKAKQVETLETLWNNTANLLDTAKSLLVSEQKVSYAFVLLQTASEEMGRIWALWLHFDGHKSVPVPPKDRHQEKHSYFIQFMSFEAVGHRTYYEIMSDIVGFKITKENARYEKTLEKIQKFREKNLYVSINPSNNHVISEPWENGTKEKQKLLQELYNLLAVYMRSMLRNLIQNYKRKK